VRVALREVARSDALVTLAAELPPSTGETTVHYATRTGALLRLDGVTAGAFDREHGEAILGPSDAPRALTLEVERRALPTNALPSGPGLDWWLLNARSAPKPSTWCDVGPSTTALRADARDDRGGLALWGHSHLDVAWLWTYEECRRKAQRTFAVALELLDRDPAFVFMQSQPQLYAFVQERDPALFERVRALAKAERFDPDVAAMWVEPDCNVPSGESLLRQMLYGHAYCVAEFDVAPSIAWLPDSFGFANTLPSLLAHCGIRRFGTTKLQWNDTTRFPHPQFRWRGPDGEDVTAVLIASYDGGITPARAAIARERAEPVVAGYGDGGGGVTYEMLDAARSAGVWQRPGRWFAALEARRDELPVHASELYLQYHRGVLTTHHDLKAANARLERRLADAEEAAAWCVAVRAPHGIAGELRARLRAAWTIVLRNQFHDVLPGTSIAAVGRDALEEYARAEEIVERAIVSSRAVLPRGGGARPAGVVVPQASPDGFVLANAYVRATVAPDGTLLECATASGPNVAIRANRLALYADTPKRWEAWNLDAGYERLTVPTRFEDARAVEEGLEIRHALGGSRAVMTLSLREDEPFLRVELVVDWRERRRILRIENALSLDASSAFFGSPHGTIERSTLADTPERRAAFEVPGQRFAYARDAQGDGLALFALDTYGWSARRTEDRALELGHSLLRGTTWPDPDADTGEHRLSWAFAPFRDVGTGAIERAWEAFACEPRVRLFDSPENGAAIVACKPAEDGDGVILRVRECDGEARSVAIRCGGRMREAVAVDGLERPLAGANARIEGESLLVDLPANALRSYRVRF
jgi:alpha-mannosidase